MDAASLLRFSYFCFMILKTSVRVLLIGFAAFFAVQYLPGFEIDDFQTLGIVATVVAVVNAILAPVISWLSFPFTILTICLIVFALNACLIKIAESFIDGFTVHGWGPALLFSLVITLIAISTDKFLLRRSF